MGHNPKSQRFGFRDQIGPLNSFDLLIDSAGGKNGVTGDYLYNSMLNESFNGGIWGIVTVVPSLSAGPVYLGNVDTNNKKTTLYGSVKAHPKTEKLPKTVSLKLSNNKTLHTKVNADGTWLFSKIKNKKLKGGFEIKSSDGSVLKADKNYLQLIKKAHSQIASKTKSEPKIIEGVKPNRVEGKKVKMN